MTDTRSDVLVVGGGLGGIAAALALCERGVNVVLTEESDWLGGQLTNQLVPPDEHPWIEGFGAPLSYRRMRRNIRDYYRHWYPLRSVSRRLDHLNPGAGRVSPLCHEPRVGVAVLEGMLAPWRASGQLTVLMEHVPSDADSDGDRVTSVTFTRRSDGGSLTVEADYVLDATETGDLLPLTGTEFGTGREAVADTGEPNAAEVAQPDNMQAVSHCFALSHHAGEDHTIDRPHDYDRWRDAGPGWWHGPQLGWVAPHPHDLRPYHYKFGPNPDDDPTQIVANQKKDPGSNDLWTFRRILARNHFLPGAIDSDVTVVNWPMIDYLDGPLYGGSEEENDRHAEGAKALSRSFLYWLQTEAPRADGGTGWPGLRLRPDITGTEDGLAKRPYIRESRRLLGQYRIVEQDLAVAVRPDGPARYADSVGVGAYRIDLHPSTGGDNYIDVPAWPFQIPLGSLVPQRVRNLIAAGKNISTTHITNGCYRVHPVEWSIGEAAGRLAAFCVERRVEPQQVTASDSLTTDLQSELERAGVELDWPDVTYW